MCQKWIPCCLGPSAALHSLQLDEEFSKQMLMIDLDVTVSKLADDEL